MTGNYVFTIEAGLKAEGMAETPWYIAEGTDPHGNSIITQGRTKEELMDNVADAFLTSAGVRLSWWNKMVKSLLIY